MSNDVKPVLRDQKYRDQILSELDHNIFVEAGAGSGKTTAMVARMVALLEHKGMHPSELCAITFTNQAARHLKEKFQLALEQRLLVLQKEPSMQAEFKNLQTAYDEMSTIFVGTIHSFCQMMLSEMPLEAGLDREFLLMNDDEEEQYRLQFWNHYKNNDLVKNNDFMHLLADMSIELDDLDPVFQMMAGSSDVVFDSSVEVSPPVNEVYETVYHWLDSIEDALPNEHDRLDSFSQLAYRLLREYQHHDGDVLMSRKVDYILQLSEWGALKIILKLWNDSELVKEVKNHIWPSLQEDLINDCAKQWMAYTYGQLMPVLNAAIKAYDQQKRNDHVLSMMDLMQRTVDMLKHQPHVRAYWQKRLRVVMVDEFQDTDPLQSELVLYLTGRDQTQTDWTQIEPLPGRLFLVGDPKQSIYRFRRADMRIYQLMKTLIQTTGGRLCPLSANFRSKASIGDWVNSCFDHAGGFPQEADEYQAQFMPLECVKDKGEQDLMKFESSAKTLALWAQDEAERIANFIALDQEKNQTAFSDYMILSYGTARLHIYEQACKQVGLPTAMIVKEHKDESLLLKDLHRFIRMMRYPAHEFLAYAVLRSSLFGFSDSQLAEYRLGTKGSFALSTLKDNMSEMSDGPIKTVWSILLRWQRFVAEEGALQALYRMWEEWELSVYAQSLPQGEHEANTVAMFLEYASSQSKGSVQSLSGLDQVMHDFIQEKHKPMHGFDQDQTNAVRLMNVHQSKGLEAKTVFIVDPAAARARDAEIYVQRDGANSKAYVSLMAMSKNKRSPKKICAQPWEWPRYAAEEKRHDVAEKQRLLYVAATRAEDRLVVTAKEKSVWGGLYASALDLSSLPLVDAPLKPAMSLPVEEAVDLSLDAWTEQWNKCKEASFISAGVTSFKGSKPALQQVGWGSVFGESMHQLFEACVRRRHEDVSEFAAMIPDYITEELHDEAERQLNFLLETDLWHRICQSSTVYVEVPFSLPDLGLEVPHVLTGSIDLVFEEEGQWVIVDYKTDRIKDEMDPFVDYYRPQLKAYQNAWENLSQTPVKECLLYFSSLGRVVNVRKLAFL